MSNIITLRQEPIISYEKIQEVGTQVKQRIEALELDKLLVTEETKNAVKNTRAELNKEFEAFETQRKLIKEAILKPYEAFENSYKNYIAQNYKNADETLKNKITAFENQLKEEKEVAVRDYFSELCESKSIDFLTFERLGLKVNLTTSLKSLKDSVLAFVEQVEKNIDLISNVPESDEFKSEALAEYKQTLDVNALRNTQIRREKREQERKILEEKERKKSLEIAQKQAQQEAQKPLQAPEVVQSTMDFSENQQVTETTENQQVTENTEVFEMTFTITGTIDQLKAVKQFLISNNINFN